NPRRCTRGAEPGARWKSCRYTPQQHVTRPPWCGPRVFVDSFRAITGAHHEGPIMRSRAIAALQILLALFYVTMGLAKIIGVEITVQEFAAIGLGQWFRIATGVLEIAGALALCLPGFAGFGALLLACIMTGAAIARLTVLDGSAAPAVMLLAVNGI